MLEGGLPGGGPLDSVKLLPKAKRAGPQSENTAVSTSEVSWAIAAEDWSPSGSWEALGGSVGRVGAPATVVSP